MCNRGYSQGFFPDGGVGLVNYGISKSVTVGKAATCDKFSDLPIAAKRAAAIDGYECIDDFPIAA